MKSVEPNWVSTDSCGSDQTEIERRRAFLNTANHELRTPLNAILGFSDIMVQELYGPLGSPSYRECAEIILASGQRLVAMLDQVIEMAKLEANTVDLAPSSLALGQELDAVIADLGPKISSSGITVERKDSNQLPRASANRQGLHTVFANLIQNACDHAGYGATLTISSFHQDQNLWIELSDDGPGIRDGDTSRMVQSFEQGDLAQDRQDMGAGLGLSIARKICHRMNGNLELHETPNGGLTIRIRLPAG